MWRRALPLLVFLGLIPGPAHATYSPPLTRVRIDRDALTHTLSVLVASDRNVQDVFDVNLLGVGGQYIGQLEWANGFGLQVGAALGGASFSGQLRSASLEAGGFFAGAQARFYYMLVSGGGEGRPHALTAFANLRGLYYQGRTSALDLSSFSLTGGIGLMGEWSILSWLSVCPYAWLSPSFTTNFDYGIAADRFQLQTGPGLRSPLLFGVDLWIYPFGPGADGHFSLSAIASLLDTSGKGARVISGSIGYTF
ncbi:MAG: hypothetical protein U1E65_22840 [Myxococcota bacterium]